MQKEKNVFGVRKELVIIYICIVAVVSLFCNVGQAILYSKALDVADESYVLLDEQYDATVQELEIAKQQLQILEDQYYETVYNSGE